MRFGLRFVVGAVAALAFGGAAHAADFDVAVGSGGYGVHRELVQYGYGGPYEHGPGWHGGWRDHDRFDGRPGPWHGGWARPAFGPAWAYGGDCRVIIRERVSPWGERVVRRIQVCD